MNSDCNKYGTVAQLTAVAVLMAVPAVATACSVCTSNLSYNAFRFTPVWLLGLMGWVGVTWWGRRLARRDGQADSIAHRYFGRARILLVAALVLYLLGLHLMVVLLFPLLLVKPARLWPIRVPGKSANPETAGGGAGSSRSGSGGGAVMRRTAQGLLAVMVVSVPLSYQVLPKALSEPGTRVKINAWKTRMTLTGPDGTNIASGVRGNDPFAIKRFDVPVLNVLVQGLDFYVPDDENTGARRARTETESIVWSRGPDGKFQLSPAEAQNLLVQTTGTQVIAAVTYDATNGSLSGGDVVVYR